MGADWDDAMKTTCYAQTNIGPARAGNEDNYYCAGSCKADVRAPVEETGGVREAERLLFGVFDGMGGEARGEDAALACAQTLAAFAQRDMQYEALAYFDAANAAVCEIGRTAGSVSGSTAAVAFLRGSHAYCYNVGDSRVYFWHGGVLRQLSRDHTKYRQLVEDGVLTEEARADCQERHMLTQYLGMTGAQQRLVPHFAQPVALEPGDRLLLCSDGLTGSLTDGQLEQMLGADLPVEAAGRALVERALAQGGTDNVTVLVVEVREVDEEPAAAAQPAEGQDLMQTRRFEVTPAARRAAQEAARRRRRRELRREAVMIAMVTLAVLLFAGTIIVISLVKTGGSRQPPERPTPTPIQTIQIPLQTYDLPTVPVESIPPTPAPSDAPEPTTALPSSPEPLPPANDLLPDEEPALPQEGNDAG